MNSYKYTEDHLVEQPAIQLMLDELDWEVVNCYDEWSGGVSDLGRDGKREGRETNIEHRTPNIEHRREEMKMIQTSPARHRLNPDLPMEAIDGDFFERVSVLLAISPGGEMRYFTENGPSFHEIRIFTEP